MNGQASRPSSARPRAPAHTRDDEGGFVIGHYFGGGDNGSHQGRGRLSVTTPYGLS